MALSFLFTNDFILFVQCCRSPMGPDSKNPYKEKMSLFDGLVQLWNVVNWSWIHVLPWHRDSVDSVAFSPS